MFGSSAIVGTCEHMCPEKEIFLRERERLLHMLELGPNPNRNCKNRPKSDVNKVIKSYSRPAAGQVTPKPSDLRPARVLLKTTKYLLTNIVTRTDVPWHVVYNFVFDRLRAVRQDMVIQCITDADCISILERIIRFHIYAAYRSYNEDISNYDPKINSDHVRECLKTLMLTYLTNEVQNNYDRLALTGVYILHNLGSDNDVLQHELSLPKSIRCSKVVSLSRQIFICHRDSNYIRFFRLVKKLPFILYCSVFPHINNFRRRGLEVMNSAYSSKRSKFPLEVLSNWFNIDDVKTSTEICLYYSLQVDSDYVSFSKAKFTVTTTFKTDLDPLSNRETERITVHLNGEKDEED
ncbi:SAC3D1 (predicted) [Pycnogonum litorale]